MSGASALEIEKLTDTGIKLGYKDEELREYVRKERELLKEERDAERDARAKERAFKEKEMEENKKAMQAKEHEIIMLMKLEELNKENAAAGANATAEKSKAKIPKLPMFNDDKDDLDAYLQRFERYATLQSWKKENWALNLSALLFGKALDVYSTLPSSEAQNYDTLKLALLRKYNLTEDGYRTKFKTSKPKDDETTSQYAARLGNYLNKWTDIVKIQQSYKGLREFMIIDQFMHSIPKEMALFLKERQPTSAGLDNITKMASQYLEAHGNNWSQNTQDKTKRLGPNKDRGENLEKRSSHTNQDENQSHTSRGENQAKFGGQNVGKKQFKCYFCQKPGHSWRNCIKAPKSFVPNMAMLIDALKSGNTSSSESNQMNSNSQINQGCTSCRMNETDKLESVACMKTQGDHHLDSAIEEGHLELKCGHRIPLLSAACMCSGDMLHTCDGYVGQTKLKMLRDSGCEGVVVKTSLVPQNSMTGQYKTCVLIDGTIRRFPVAMIEIDTPYLTGKVLAKCMENPVYDLIVGQGVGARDLTDSNPNWEPWSSGLSSDSQSHDKDINRCAAAISISQTEVNNEQIQPREVSQPLPNTVLKETLREEKVTNLTLDTIHEVDHPETKSYNQYVSDSRDQLEQRCQTTNDVLAKTVVKPRSMKAKSRQNEIEDEVVLLPIDNNRLLKQCRVPSEIVKKQNSMNYSIKPTQASARVEDIQPRQHLEMVCTAVVEESDSDEFDYENHSDGGIHITTKSNLILLTIEQSETYKDMQMNQELVSEKICRRRLPQ